MIYNPHNDVLALHSYYLFKSPIVITTKYVHAIAMQSSNPIGYVEYEIDTDGSLSGDWVLRAESGTITGSERAWGGEPGTLPGTYRVEIFSDGSRVFSGRLLITSIDATKKQYAMQWNGKDASDQKAVYYGVGMNDPEDRLTALWNSNTDLSG